VVKDNKSCLYRSKFCSILEIEDGEDETIEHEDDFLEKLKGKVWIL
jgi:hypothetical protein